MTVAIAAPFIPKSKPKIKIGSKIIANLDSIYLSFALLSQFLSLYIQEFL